MVRAILCGMRGPKWRYPLLVGVITFSWGLPIGGASTTYTGIVLYPLNPPAGSHQQIQAVGSAANGQVVGSSMPNSQFGIQQHALLWDRSPSPIDLGLGAAGATDGIQQVGDTPSFDGRLWTGTAASVVNLGSDVVVTGVGGGEQVGWDGVDTALVWHGTAGSVVRINPSGYASQANGTDGVHQVGQGSGSATGFSNHALMWSGTTASTVDLNPAQFKGMVGSIALGVGGNQQVGYVDFPAQDPQSPTARLSHAVLWKGTASSAVDLNPAGRGWYSSRANGTNGTQQAGFVVLTSLTGPVNAAMWSGTTDSAVDLHTLLPATFAYSIASFIDAAGDVFGVANDAWINGTPAGRYYAVEWLPHAVVPGDVNLDGKVDFSDFVTLARDYGQTGGWLQGDFDNDGTVGFDDLVILARNYGQALPTAQLAQLNPSLQVDVERAFADVPEPSFLAVLPLGAGLLLGRHRRWRCPAQARIAANSIWNPVLAIRWPRTRVRFARRIGRRRNRRPNGKAAMQESSTKRIYDIHSMFYDATFGRLVRRRVARAISHMNIRPGDRVLDLGVGTGVSLSYYPLDRGQIVGIDLSSGMLREARKKIREQARTNATVFQADAMRLPFGDDSFDHVFISHVISVVSDPCRLVQEAQRVAKADSRIVIVNHFQSTNRFIALFEKWLCPLCTALGWRSDLVLQDLIRQTGAEIDYRYKLESIDLWETVVMTNNKSALAPVRGTIAA